MRAHLRPALIGRERRAIGVVGVLDQGIVHLLAELVPGGQAQIAAAGDVDRRKVQGLAEQGLLQGRCDELVHLIGDLLDRALNEARRTVGREAFRIEEGIEQRLLDHRSVRLHDIQRLGEHGMAEAEHGLGELQAHRQVDVRGVGHELRQVRHQAADILVDGDVVVLGLGDGAGRLEENLAIPGDVAIGIQIDAVEGERLRHAIGIGVVEHMGAGDGGRRPLAQPLIDEVGRRLGAAIHRIGENVGRLQEDRVLDIVDLEVVLLVPDMVHGGEEIVLVHPPVAGDAMRIEQLVVIGEAAGGIEIGNLRIVDDAVGIGRADNAAEARIGRRIDVDQKRLAGAQHLARDGIAHIGVVRIVHGRRIGAGVDRIVRVRRVENLPLGIDLEHGHVEHVRVRKKDADALGIDLDVRPRRQPRRLSIVGRVVVGDEGGVLGHHAPRRVPVRIIFAQDHVDARVRAIGLALVDQEAGIVVVDRRDARIEDAIGEIAVRIGEIAPRNDHLVAGRLAEERVPRLERNLHEAAGAILLDEIEAVVEELAEEHEPVVVGRPAEGTGIGYEGGRIAIRVHDVLAARGVPHRHGGRVVERAGRIRPHVGDEIRDHPRRGVRHARAIGRVAGARPGLVHACAVHRLAEAQEGLVRRPPGAVRSGTVGVGIVVQIAMPDQIVVRPRRLTHTARIEGVGELCVVDSNRHLTNQKIQILPVQMHHGSKLLHWPKPSSRMIGGERLLSRGRPIRAAMSMHRYEAERGPRS